MSWFHQYKLTTSYLAPALAFVIIMIGAAPADGQSNPPASPFRAGQSMYIVAFRHIHFPIILGWFSHTIVGLTLSSPEWKEPQRWQGLNVAFTFDTQEMGEKFDAAFRRAIRLCTSRD